MMASEPETSPWSELTARLVAALKPFAAPVAISFGAKTDPLAAPRRNTPYAETNEHGRTGQVPAGCMFWIYGAADTFATTAPDHANCSVGSLTHGFLSPAEAATKVFITGHDESWVRGPVP